MSQPPRRPGGGRKPKGDVLQFHQPDTAALREPPVDLSDKHKSVWRELAPLAVDEGTLVVDTVPGFRELVELMVMKADLVERLHKFGTDSRSGLERMRSYTRLSARCEAVLARFKLTAFGKPAATRQKAAAPNPWAAFRSMEKP